MPARGRFCELHRAPADPVASELRQRAAEARKRFDENRPSAARRGYNRDWAKARLVFLTYQPLCAECKRNGRIVAAEVVDHIVPHKGDRKLFSDRRNWQSLCKSCHNRKSARETARALQEESDDAR